MKAADMGPVSEWLGRAGKWVRPFLIGLMHISSTAACSGPARQRAADICAARPATAFKAVLSFQM